MKVGENALAEFLDALIVWETKIVAILRTNRALKRLNICQQQKYDDAIRCDICRYQFVEGETKGPKVRNHDHITGMFIGPAHSQFNLERPVSFKSRCLFTTFVDTMHT